MNLLFLAATATPAATARTIIRCDVTDRHTGKVIGSFKSADKACQLTAIATDLALCDLGLAMTRGKLRSRYAAHRRACLAAIEAIDPMPALELSDVDLLAEFLGA